MKAERDRLQGMLEHAEKDLNVYLQQTIDVKAENARLRDAEAERDRLLEERDEWKAGTFPGWTRDDVYKDLADKYRELKAERDVLQDERDNLLAERDKLRGEVRNE